MAVIIVGDAQAIVSASGAVDGDLECDFAHSPASLEFLARCTPGAEATVFIAGAEFTGFIKITDPDDYLTVVEF